MCALVTGVQTCALPIFRGVILLTQRFCTVCRFWIGDWIIWTIKRKQTVERAKRWPYPFNLPHGREQRAAGLVLPRWHLCGKKCFVDERADDENLIGARRRCRDLHRYQPVRQAQRLHRKPGRPPPRNSTVSPRK